MSVAVLQPQSDGIRKRKAHRKSRQGCSNCKLRRVKCDEVKPQCNKCVDYGVSCSYGSRADEDLQMSLTGSFMMHVSPVSPARELSLNRTITTMINGPMTKAYDTLPFPTYVANEVDLATLQRFQERTVRTIGTQDTWMLYRDVVLRLACHSPFLMHIVLTLTLMHDRFVEGSHKPSVKEAFHWYRGTALFNAMIGKPIKNDDKDALWASAALLGAIACANIDDQSPETVWPLKPVSMLDLDWLRISDGKREIARLAELDRPESVFCGVLGGMYSRLLANVHKQDSDFRNVPDGFTDLFELDDPSERHNNPYYRAAVLIDQLLPGQCTYANVLHYLSFIGFMPPEFKVLLEQRDLRAMLMMAYWYAKMCEYKQWWIFKRASVECQAICVYMRRFHWQQTKIIRLLKYPQKMCGLKGTSHTTLKLGVLPF